jgi:hypothetical protein
VKAEFPVLLQEKWPVSKKYEVMVTPFAFLIDENGVVRSKGIVSSKKHLGFVLEGRRDEKDSHEEPESDGAEASERNGSNPDANPKEEIHV